VAALVITGGLKFLGSKRPILFSQPLSLDAAIVFMAVCQTVLLEPYLKFAQHLIARLLPLVRFPLLRQPHLLPLPLLPALHSLAVRRSVATGYG